MCFSAEASFAASAALTVCGAVAVQKAQTKAQKAFAVIPLFFAVQQFTEGLLWLSLTRSIYGGWTNLATHVFLAFAWVIWPSYVPLSIRLLEKTRKRKLWLNLFVVVGIGVSAVLTYSLVFHEVRAMIEGNHIKYVTDFQLRYPNLFGIFYFIPIVISLLISGRRKMWVVGLLIFLSFIITALFYRQHLISVWCFFAAITSLLVLWMVYRISKKEWKPPQQA